MNVENIPSDKATPKEVMKYLVNHGTDKMMLYYHEIAPEVFQSPIVFEFIGNGRLRAFKRCIQSKILSENIQDENGNTWMHRCAFVCVFLSNEDIAKEYIDCVMKIAPSKLNSLNSEEKSPLDVLLENRRGGVWKNILTYMLAKGFVCNIYKDISAFTSPNPNVDDIEKQVSSFEIKREQVHIEKERKKREERLEASHAQFERDSAQIRQNVQMKWGSILRQREREKREREQELQREQERKMELFRKEEKLRKEMEKRAKREREEMDKRAKRKREEMEKILKEPPPIHSTLRNSFFDRCVVSALENNSNSSFYASCDSFEKKVDESVFRMESE